MRLPEARSQKPKANKTETRKSKQENNNKTRHTMKKTIITLTLILGITMTSFAEGGLFNRGNNAKYGQNSGYIYFIAQDPVREDVAMPLLPNHGESGNQPAPLGSGIAVLMGLGAAYLVGKKRREE
jgi:hypothetical protein